MHVNLAWRLVAGITLFIYALLVFVLILLFAHNIAFGALLGLTAMLLVYAIWLLLSRAGRRARAGRLLFVAVVAALVAELVYFLSDAKNRRALLAVAGLSVVYIGLIALLRKRYWSEKRRQAELSGGGAHFENPYALC